VVIDWVEIIEIAVDQVYCDLYGSEFGLLGRRRQEEHLRAFAWLNKNLHYLVIIVID